MKTIEECLDDAVKRKSEYSDDFKELMIKFKKGDCVRVFVESVIEEAMQEYAKQTAIAQREACAEKYYKDDGIDQSLYNDILNTKLVVD